MTDKAKDTTKQPDPTGQTAPTPTASTQTQDTDTASAKARRQTQKTPSTIADVLETYVEVKPLTNSFYNHEGVCTKCGWHTMQLDDQAAHDLVLQHAQQHWKDAQTILQATSSKPPSDKEIADAAKAKPSA